VNIVIRHSLNVIMKPRPRVVSLALHRCNTVDLSSSPLKTRGRHFAELLFFMVGFRSAGVDRSKRCLQPFDGRGNYRPGGAGLRSSVTSAGRTRLHRPRQIGFIRLFVLQIWPHDVRHGETLFCKGYPTRGFRYHSLSLRVPRNKAGTLSRRQRGSYETPSMGS
jgi:hypothetical protein